MPLCPVEEHQSWVKCNVEHWRPKGHNINSDIIPVLIAEDHSIKHRIMEDISIEQRKFFLNMEKGWNSRPFTILSWLRNNKVS